MDIRQFFKTGRSTDKNIAAGEHTPHVDSGSTCALTGVTATITDLSDSDLETSDSQVLVGDDNATYRRPCDLGTHSPIQPEMQPSSCPLTAFGRKMRRFNPGWFSGRPWLEHSVERDAVFCFPCHKMCSFLITRQATADNVFTVRGYRNWKKGIGSHELSYAHRTAMMLWNESKERQEKGKEISTMVNDEQLQRNRYYVQSVMDVIFFLASNELSFRGDHESGALSTLCQQLDSNAGTEEPCGLFIKLFQYTVTKDEKLRNICRTIPENASYTSPQFQNEVIGHLADLVRECVVNELADKWYTILCDETRDASGIENMAIVLRFADDNGDICEHLLCMGQVTKFDAVSLVDALLGYLQQYNIRLDRMLAQCYDGASVMAGHSGGVQAIVQLRLQRKVPYVHCFNHQLHLVVCHAISCVPAAANFFNVCEQLYNFFRRPNIKSMYDGESLKRVLAQRWEGHLAAAVALDKSMDDVTAVLEACELTVGEAGVIAAGLLKRVSDRQFRFLTKCMPALLHKLDVPNKILQSRTASFQDAIRVIHETKEIISEMHSEECFDSYWNQLTQVSCISCYANTLVYIA
jgi:hypothetical protein